MMLTLSLAEIAQALGHVSGDIRGAVTGISVDSRRVVQGDLFVALAGSRTSGERFIDEAFERGAAAVVASHAASGSGSLLRVDDPLMALSRVARLVRRRFRGPVVGITGTVGKTSVKEYLRALVPERLRGVFPPASFNNAIGVPLTLAGVEEDSGLLVLELGSSAPGEIAALCATARPTVGVMTAIGPGHLEGLGSVEQVLEEKLQLAHALPEGAPLFINNADRWLRDASYPTNVRLVRTGLEEGGGDLVPRAGSGPDSWLLGSEGPEISLPLRSRVGRTNLWLALSLAQHLGCRNEELAAGVRNLRPLKLRGEEVMRGKRSLVLDCYNANPLSMAAALEDLALKKGPRAAVLGQMLELGAETAAHHQELGRRLAGCALEAILFIGQSGPDVRSGFLEAGGDATILELFPDLAAARSAFRALLDSPGVVLVKGSRALALERLAEVEE